MDAPAKMVDAKKVYESVKDQQGVIFVERFSDGGIRFQRIGSRKGYDLGPESTKQLARILREWGY